MSKLREPTAKVKPKIRKFDQYIFKAGLVLIGIGVIILFFIYLPIGKEELKYSINKENYAKITPTPVDKKFGLMIPKLGINTKVVANIDPYNPKIYQVALTKGVAHALGTRFPGENGTVFIFAHSSENLMEARRYNSVFYLVDKLKKGDKIIAYKNGKKYEYKLQKKEIVNPENIAYLNQKDGKEQLVLMTCWPPGTTEKRMIVVAKPVKTDKTDKTENTDKTSQTLEDRK